MALTIAINALVDILAAIAFIYNPDAVHGGITTVFTATLHLGSNLFIAWMGFAMTCAKYRDKTDRKADQDEFREGMPF